MLDEPCLAVDDCPPFNITMTNFGKHKRDDDTWYSDPFYTHPHGYKMCLGVYANGYGDGEGTHVRMFVCLMHGKFDNSLKWPFRGDITIQLLNQLAGTEHHLETISFTARTPNSAAGRVTGERNLGKVCPKFVAHSELKYNSTKNRQYLMDDCLCFRVTKVEVKN